jgi:hypothetical protein
MRINPAVYALAGQASKRVKLLRNVPVVKLLALAEIVLLARDHIERLTPSERRRVVILLRTGRGRPSRLSHRERDELARLVAKAEPRGFVGEAANTLSPVPLPDRIVHGRKHDASG